MCWQVIRRLIPKKERMKRINNIYEKIYDLENLRRAHQMAKKDKSHYESVQKVEADLDNRLLLIQKMLKDKTYHVGQYKISIIEDKGKKRLLHKLPYFPDRIIQWAIMLQIEETFTKTFTNFSCASLKGRGTRYATKILSGYLRDKSETQYCLKIDVLKFYPNIDRSILKQLLRKKFKDKELLWLLDNIIDSMDNASYQGLSIPEEFKAVYFQQGKGIPIGSYLSQYLANFYLTYFDHWLKEKLGCRYVVRYMDDIVVLHNSKRILHEWCKKIQDYLNNNLRLLIKGNWQVFPVEKRGIDFVGFRHFHHFRLLRKRILKNTKRATRAMSKYPNKHNWSACISYYGWLVSSNSYNFFKKRYGPLLGQLNNFYNLNIRGPQKNEHEVISFKKYSYTKI